MNKTHIFKKMLAAFSATAVGATCVGFSASALTLDPVEELPYQVVMSFQAGSDMIWDPGDTNVATIESDGSYEVSYTFVEGSASVEAVILDTDINAYAYAPEDCTDPIAEGSVKMTIDAITLVRADGTEDAIDYNGPSKGAYRTGDNGTSIRYNILNNWTSPAVADIDAALPGDGALAGDTFKVSFTIKGITGEADTPDTPIVPDTPTEDDFVIPEDAYYTFMSIQAGAEQLWEATEQNTAIFTADGTYDMSYTFTVGSASIEACIIDSNINAYDFAPEETTDPIAEGSVKMTIDSVKLVRADGTEEVIEYTPSAVAFRVGDNGSSIRYNILNTWSKPVTADISSTLPGEGANEGDTLTVTFTISGLGNSPFSEVVYGDIDGDGVVALNDGSAVLSEYAKIAAGLTATFTDAQKTAADVDGDGVVSLSDASKILGYYAACAAGLNPDPADFFTVMK